MLFTTHIISIGNKQPAQNRVLSLLQCDHSNPTQNNHFTNVQETITVQIIASMVGLVSYLLTAGNNMESCHTCKPG